MESLNNYEVLLSYNKYGFNAVKQSRIIDLPFGELLGNSNYQKWFKPLDNPNIPGYVLAEIFEKGDEKTKLEVLKHPNIPSSIINEITALTINNPLYIVNPDSFETKALSFLLKNPKLPVAIIKKITSSIEKFQEKDYDAKLVESLLENPRTPTDCIDTLYEYYLDRLNETGNDAFYNFEEIEKAIALNPNTSPDRLKSCYYHGIYYPTKGYDYNNYRNFSGKNLLVLENPHAPLELFKDFIKSRYYIYANEEILSNPALTSELLQTLYKLCTENEFRLNENTTAIAGNPSISKELFNHIMRRDVRSNYTSNTLVMKKLAKSLNIDAETLEKMYKSDSIRYKSSIIDNPNCTPELIAKIFDDWKANKKFLYICELRDTKEFEEECIGITQNPNSPSSVLDEIYSLLLKSPVDYTSNSDKMIEFITNNPNASERLLRKIISTEINEIKRKSGEEHHNSSFTNLKRLFNALENLNGRNRKTNSVTFGDNKYQLEIIKKGSRVVSKNYGKFDDSYSFILPIDYVTNMEKSENVDTLLDEISKSQIKNKRANSISYTITGLKGAFKSDNYEDLISEIGRANLDSIIERQSQTTVDKSETKEAINNEKEVKRYKPDLSRYYDEDMDIKKTLEEVKKRMGIEEPKETEPSPNNVDINDTLIKYKDRIALEKKQAEEERNRKYALEVLKKKREAAVSALNELSVAEQKVTTKTPITRKSLDLSNFLLKEGDHFVINPVYIKYGLENINLCTVDFTNVDVKGIDFRNTNAVFDPKKVYNKDIRGTKFSTDNTLLFGFGYDKLLDGTKYDSQTHVEDPFDCLDDEPRVMQ